MCTASWLTSPDGRDGYELLFNRDELLRRAPALPPRRGERCGIRYLATVDGEAGGAWLAVNQFGLSLGLLNRYPRDPRSEREAPASPVSRGHLVIEQIDAQDPAEVERRLLKADLGRFRPFTLLALAPAEAPRLFAWNGETLVRALEPTPPLISSSVAEAEALTIRTQSWNAFGPPTHVRGLLAFHRSHSPSASAASVCMHREDAQTVSLTRVSVSPEAIALRYSPGPPCGRAPERRLRLVRTTALPPRPSAPPQEHPLGLVEQAAGT